MKFLAVLLLTTATLSAQAQTITAACKNSDTEANMRALTLVATKTATDVSISVTFTDSDPIIQNKVVTGTAAVSSATAGAYNVAVNLDPYAGQVGTFYWTFGLKDSFFSTALPTTYQPTDSSTFFGYEWAGTPAGQGNNTGEGMIYSWYCHAL